MVNSGRLLLGSAGGVDLRQFIKDLVFNTDAIYVKVRGLRLNLGNGRWASAFSGYVEYVTYTDKPSLMKILLNMVNAYGVGKDRALGLGYVNAEVIKQQTIRRLNK